MLKIFISYRREDSAFETTAVHEKLAAEFGAENVFLDVDSIPVGLDFRKVIRESVHDCDVLIAIVGERWLVAADPSGQRRLDKATDFVRIEIEAALERDVPVIPVFVGRATMPDADQLPPSLHEFVFRNGLSIRPGKDFRHDIGDLIRQIRLTCEYSQGPSTASRPAEETAPNPAPERGPPGPLAQTPAAIVAAESFTGVAFRPRMWPSWLLAFANGTGAGAAGFALGFAIGLLDGKLRWTAAIDHQFLLMMLLASLFAGLMAPAIQAWGMTTRWFVNQVLGPGQTVLSPVAGLLASAASDAGLIAFPAVFFAFGPSLGGIPFLITFATLYPSFLGIRTFAATLDRWRPRGIWEVVAKDLLWFAAGIALGIAGMFTGLLTSYALGDSRSWLSMRAEMVVIATAGGGVYAAILAGNRAIFPEAGRGEIVL